MNSNIKSKLPRPEDLSQALYTFDIGQNDLDGAFKSMTQKQAIESVPGIINQFAQAVKVTKMLCLHNISVFSFLE